MGVMWRFLTLSGDGISYNFLKRKVLRKRETQKQNQVTKKRENESKRGRKIAVERYREK